MKTQHNRTKMGIGTGMFVVLLGLSVLAFAGNLRPVRPSVTVMKPPASPPIDPGAGSTSIFVRFEAVDGDSVDATHRNWSDVRSFRQGQSSPPRSQAGGSLRRASAVFADLVLTKELDKSSPRLADAVCRGKIFPRVQIHATRPIGGARRVFYAYELRNVLVSSYEVTGVDSALPVEEIALSFEEIGVTYTEYDGSGKPQGNVEYNWNLAQNK